MCTRAVAADSQVAPRAQPRVVGSRRNFVLGVLNGAVGSVALEFIHPELILAGLIYGLTGSPLLVALIPIISKGGALLPQLYVGSHLEHVPRKRPAYVALTVARSVGAGALVTAIWLLTQQVNALTLGLFFAAYLVISVCGGSSHVVFLDMTGRLVRTDRLGTFLGTREFLGGSLAILAGLYVIQPVLRLEGTGLPHRYLVLAIVGGILTVAAMALFCLCREDDGPRARRRTTLGESFRRGIQWLRTDSDYRVYFWLRVAFRVNYLVLAFFIPYGEERLAEAGSGLGVAVLGGVLVASFKLSRVISSAVWGRAADRGGFRTCMVGAGVSFLLAPVLALVAPVLPRAFGFRIPGTEVLLDLPLCVYLLALVSLGAAFQASIIGGHRFLLVRAPPHRRISYVGFLNTITSPLTLLPFLGGLMVFYVSATALFGVLVGGGLLYLFWALRMPSEHRGASGDTGGGPPVPAEAGA